MTFEINSGIEPGLQHGARAEILGRIRRALKVPARPGHVSATAPHPAPVAAPVAAPEAIAPDNSNPLGTNASPVPNARDAKQARLEGEEIGIRATPARAEDAPEIAGWVPGDGSSAASSAASSGEKRGKSIPLPVLNGSAWRAWLPQVGEAYEDQVALLEKNLFDLKAEFVRVQGAEALQVLAGEMARENGWSRIARHASPLLDRALGSLVGEVQVLGGGGEGFSAEALEGCEAGWTTCDALIAQTGTVLLSAREAGGRALSVLPPHHVVVATREQIVADLPTAFEGLQRQYETGLPSSITFITGPSRTGDIERILVLGAHGPKRLTILLVE